MKSLNSKIIILGERPPIGLSMQVQYFSRFQDTISNPVSYYDILVLPILMALSAEAGKYIHMTHARNPALQIVLVAPPGSAIPDLEECINKFPIFSIIDSYHILELEPALLSAIARTQELRQNQQLESLVREQNERLKNIHKELEDRVEKRQSFLLESRSKTLVANSRWEAILKATEIIQQAESLGDIENSLTKILTEDMRLVLTRIYFKPQDTLFRDQQKAHKIYALHQTSLLRGADESILGSIFFLRAKEFPFRRDETDFLQKIAEVVSLAIDRLDKLKQTVSFKEQWEATFNAVVEPVVILNENYEVLQNNLGFQKKSAQNFSGTGSKGLSRKCYEALFGRQSPCEGCQLGQKFRVTQKNEEASSFDVFSQPLPSSPGESKLFVNQYHEVTKQLKMEKKIMETARLAEIGTIGSSIAHELNNPLGGMLSFAQLIKLDLASDHPLYADVLELENGVKRCRDIVQNLLGFSRNPAAEEWSRFKLMDVLQRALRIVELQSRSMGVEIKINHPSSEIYVEGYFGHLSQSVQNILQFSLQNISEASQAVKNFKGLIEIQLHESDTSAQIKILDNSPVLPITQEPQTDKTNSLGLSLAKQILHDHRGNLHLEQDSRPFRVAIITLPRPVLPH